MLTQATEKQIIQHILGIRQMPKPRAVYVALMIGDTGLMAMANRQPKELSGRYYRRERVAGWTWNAKHERAENAKAVQFVINDAWETVTHFGLFDAPRGGRLMAWGRLTAPLLTGGVGDTLRFAAGDLSVAL